MNPIQKFVAGIVIFSAPLGLSAQKNISDTTILKQIAGKIIQSTEYIVLDTKSGMKYSLPITNYQPKEYTVNCPHLTWEYWNGVTNLAMLNLAETLSDTSYSNYAWRNYDFVFDNIEFFRFLYDNNIENTGIEKLFRMHMLDDCGSLAAGMAEIYLKERPENYRYYLDTVADYILNREHRLADGTLARTGPSDKTVWLDDLYMSIPFIARYALITEEEVYFDFACKQIINYQNYLYDANTGIYYHCYFDDKGENGVARWGRANGWAILAMVNLLDALPEDHPKRIQVLSVFRQHVIGLARYQSQSGLWHQLIDKSDSYLETSSSAMFTYAIAKGVNKGWIEKPFETIALAGWEGLMTKIDSEGNVAGICVGTWIQNDLPFYYNRPVQQNDIHGIGAVLLAGSEVIRLKRGAL